MVNVSQHFRRRTTGSLMPELLVAMTLLVIAVLPIGYSLASERMLARACYERAVAMEIVDGEMEALLAGEWRTFPVGTRDYPVHANATTNLTAGNFILTIQPSLVRLEWRPAEKHHGGPIVREAVVK